MCVCVYVQHVYMCVYMNRLIVLVLTRTKKSLIIICGNQYKQKVYHSFTFKVSL